MDDIKGLKSDLLLRYALAEQLEQDPEVRNFLPESELESCHVFSASHEQKMKNIFRIARKAQRRLRHPRRMMQAVACIVAFLCVSTVTISSVDAFRVPVLSFFMDIRDKATQYQLSKRDRYVTKYFQEHEPSYIPEGFYVDRVNETENFFHILYATGARDQWYEVTYVNEPSTISFDTEESISLETEVNGNKTLVIHKDRELRAAMYMRTSHILLTGTISWEEAEKVLKSMK